MRFAIIKEINKDMKLTIRHNILFFSTLMLLLLSACAEEDKPLDAPFVYLTDKFGGISATMDSKARYTATYFMKLSSKLRTGNLEVQYKVVPGNGLQEGVDFSLTETNSNPIVFEPGVYEKTIQINWLPNNLNNTKDNTVRIILVSSNDPSVNIGRLGPDKLGSEYTIKKE